MDYTILVNRNKKIPKTVPKLIKVNSIVSPTIDEESDIYLEEKTYSMWNKLENDAKNEGYFFQVISGYRTSEYQQKLLEYYIDKIGFDKAIMRVAIPNYSEHQTGLAIDFCYFRKDDNNTDLFTNQVDIIDDNDPEFIWILENMKNYGFILRYPKDKSSITGYTYEPWHIRYVGIDLANTIMNNNLTLEEYYEKKLHK